MGILTVTPDDGLAKLEFLDSSIDTIWIDETMWKKIGQVMKWKEGG